MEDSRESLRNWALQKLNDKGIRRDSLEKCLEVVEDLGETGFLLSSPAKIEEAREFVNEILDHYSHYDDPVSAKELYERYAGEGTVPKGMLEEARESCSSVARLKLILREHDVHYGTKRLIKEGHETKGHASGSLDVDSFGSWSRVIRAYEDNPK